VGEKVPTPLISREGSSEPQPTSSSCFSTNNNDVNINNNNNNSNSHASVHSITSVHNSHNVNINNNTVSNSTSTHIGNTDSVGHVEGRGVTIVQMTGSSVSGSTPSGVVVRVSASSVQSANRPAVVGHSTQPRNLSSPRNASNTSQSSSQQGTNVAEVSVLAHL